MAPRPLARTILIVGIFIAAFAFILPTISGADEYRVFIPISGNKFEATPPGNRITDVVFDPPSPAEMAFFEKVFVSFNYVTDEPGGVRIGVEPYSNGQRAFYGGWAGSDIIPPGSGSIERWFFVHTESTVVDQVRVLMNTADGLTTLYEEFYDVSYTYSD